MYSGEDTRGRTVSNDSRRGTLIIGLAILTLCLFSIGLIASCDPEDSSAVTFTDENGFVYVASGTTASVQSYVGEETVIEIPSTVTYNYVTYNVTSIGSEAFMGSKIVELAETGNVTSIGESAFNGCIFLGTIKLSAPVREIEISAFNGCKSLSSVSLNEGLETISYYSFASCTSLYSITIPSTVTSLSYTAFQGASKLTNITVSSGNSTYASFNEDGILYSVSGTKLILCPEGKKGSVNVMSRVTAIGDYAFFNCINITEVSFGTTQNFTIGSNSFNGCSSLKSLNGYSKLVSLGSSAFRDCIWLTKFEFTNLKEVPESAFEGCSSLTSASFTASTELTTICASAFKGCVSLGSVTFPSGLETIDTEAFKDCTALTTVIFVNTVKSIGNEAFSGCSAIKDLTFSDSVSMTSTSFDGCTGLETLTIIKGKYDTIDYNETSYKYTPWFKSSEKEITVYFKDALTKIGNYMFCECDGLYNLQQLSATHITTIGNYAFYECVNLKSNPLFPSTLTAIGEYAFYGCTGIAGNITITDNISELGSAAFAACTQVTGFELKSTLYFETVDGILFNKEKTKLIQCYGAFDQEYTIPDYVTEIGSGAFAGCSKMTGSMMIPAKVTVIGAYAFEGCSGLTGTLTLPSSLKSIGSHAFSDCSGLTGNLTIPTTVVTIGTYAFRGCSHLTGAINIPTNMTTVPEGIFANCFSFSSIYIHDGVKEIKAYAFSKCTGLKGTLTISDNVTKIGDSAFYDCNQINTLSIPVTTTYESHTFTDCTGLTNITLTKGSTGSSVDYKTSTYQNTPWYISVHSGQNNVTVTFGDGITKIGNYMFCNCSDGDAGLAGEIVLPETLTSIGMDAFYGCKHITKISVGKGVDTIGKEAFVSCSELVSIEVDEDNVNYSSLDGILFDKDRASIIVCPGGYAGDNGSYTIPDNISTLTESAFQGCVRLTEIIIPDTVRTLSDKTFADCSALKHLSMPIDVGFSSSAFSGCVAIDNITLTAGKEGKGPDWSVSSGRVNLPWFVSESESITVTVESGVVSIGASTFADSKVTSVVLPLGLEKIGRNAFANCTSLSSLTMPVNLEIPTAWDTAAFSRCSGLTSVTLIGNTEGGGTRGYDYAGETAVQYTPWYISRGNDITLHINEGVTSIGDYMFANCTGIIDYTLPSSLTEIGVKAFYKTNGPDKVTIGKDVDTIGDMAFSCSPNIELFTVVEGNTHFKDDNGVLYLLDADGEASELIQCPTGYNSYYEISSSTKKISSYAFNECTQLPGVTIPSGVTELGTYAFCNCSSIRILTMPISLGITTNTVFSNCTSIEEVYFTDSDETPFSYTSRNYMFTPWYKSARAGTSIEVTFESGITSIGDYMFYNCSYGGIGLETVTIPNTVTYVSRYAFTNTTTITELTLPISLDCSDIFSGTGLKKVTFTKGGYGMVSAQYTKTNYSTLPWYKNQHSSIEVILEDGIDSIGSYTFTKTMMDTLVIPDSVTSIGEHAFQNCSSLTELTMSANLENMYTYAFAGCTSLTTLVVKGSITDIPAYAFADCTGLLKISFNTQSESFGEGAFSGCTALESIVIPDTITSIGDGAFERCNNLTDLTMPMSYTIDHDIFSNCKTISSITFTYGSGSIPDYTEDTVTKTPWYITKTELTVKFQQDAEFTAIGKYMFYQCGSLVSIELPETLGKIDDYAFKETSLTKIIIPDSVDTLGIGAFSGCSALLEVVVGDNVEYVGSELFANCTNLISLQIPASLTISSNMYSQCNSLTTLTLTTGTLQGKTHEYTESEYRYTAWYQSSYYGNQITVILCNGVNELNGYMFHDCTNIVKISFYDENIDFTNHGTIFGNSIKFLNESDQVISLSHTNMASSSFSYSYDEYGVYYLKRSKIVQVSSITFSEVEKSVTDKKNSKFTLTPTILPADASNKECIWTSSDTSVLRVDQDGKVTVLKAGFATIRVTWVENSEMFADCDVTVKHDPQYVAAKDPDCRTMTDGNVAYYRCLCCGAKFKDQACTIPETSPSIKVTHTLEELSAKDATCREAGNDHCYHCTVCDCYFLDAAGTIQTTYPEIPKLSHDMTFIKGEESSGRIAGTINHYHCSLCDMDYTDSLGTVTLTDLSTYDVVIQVNNGEYGRVTQTLLKNILSGAKVTTVDNLLTIDGYTNGDTGAIHKEEAIYALPTDWTAERTYTFSHWEIGVDTITAYTVCLAVFESEVRSYDVIFYSADGVTPYEQNKLDYGSVITEPATPPKKEDSVEYVYSFSKWLDQYGNEYVTGDIVTGELKYTPQYTSEYRNYRITFKNEDTVFEQYYLQYGATIVLPENNPTKTQTTSTVYVFIGWTNYEPGMIADFNYTFYAEYREDIRYYTARFLSDDNVFVEFNDLQYEAEIPDPGTPTKESTDMYHFEFTSWDYYTVGVRITEDVDYNAIYTRTLYAYTVDAEGNVTIDSTDVTSFNIDRDAIIKLKKDAMNNTVVSFAMTFASGAIKLDSAAILSLTNTKQKVSFDVLDYDRMPSAMKEVVKERTVYNINIGTVHQFDGTLTITINYEPSPREDTRNLVIWYVTTSGTYQEIACTFANNQVTFETNHLSYYSVVLSEPAPDAEYWPKIMMVLAGAAIILLAIIAIKIARRYTL